MEIKNLLLKYKNSLYRNSHMRLINSLLYSLIIDLIDSEIYKSE